MARKITLPVDPEKMRGAFARRDLQFAETSRELGYDSGYISGCLNERKITKTAALLLEQLYNISAEEYMPDQQPQPIGAQQTKIPEVDELPSRVTIDMEALRETIAQAVVDATVSLIQSPAIRGELQKMLYQAIKGTLLEIKREKLTDAARAAQAAN